MLPLYGIADDEREALMAATAKTRAEVARWLLGQADFPAEGFAAVAEAETKAAGTSEAYKSLLPQREPQRRNCSPIFDAVR